MDKISFPHHSGESMHVSGYDAKNPPTARVTEDTYLCWQAPKGTRINDLEEINGRYT